MRRASSLFLFVLISVSAVLAQQFDSSLYSGMRWRMVGPFRGGRSIAVAGVPSQPDVFYFGSVGGGVWKTEDAGRTWSPIFDSQPIASIGAIAVSASNPEVIYVGSGEADMRSQISYGDGMYKSTDGGKTWRNIGLRDTRQIGRILVDPRNPDLVLVAALGHAYGPNEERGVFRSADGGTTWQKVLYKDANTGAIDLASSAQNPQTVYASLWQTRRPPWSVYPPSNGPGSGLYKSTDGGATWNQITGNGFPSEGLGRIGIAVAPSDPNRVYAIVDAKEGGLYRSDDAGATWQRADSETRIWGRGWYFGQVAADPKDENTLYVMNTSTYRSRDGGHSFDAIKGAPGGDDYHQLWINPNDPNRMGLAADQGTVISIDDAQNWSSWYNQPTAQIYHVVTDNDFPYRIYGAQQDSGSIVVPSRSKFLQMSFRDYYPACAGGESGYLAPDPKDANVLFGGTVERCDQNVNVGKNVSPTIGVAGVFRNTWTLPLVFSPVDHALYFSHQMLFKSTNNGQSWQQISPDLTREDPGTPPNLDPTTAQDANEKSTRRGVIYTIAPSPREANRIWVGTDDGLIQLTTDGGRNWKNVTPPELIPWSKVGIIEASHFDPQSAYAAVDRHRLEDYRPYIYRTHDGGRTWQKITTGLPETTYVNVVREDPERKGLLFAGSELGAFVSFDDGDHWQTLQLNLPVVSVRDLAVHDNDLIAATHGRSFWVLDDITPLRQLAANVASAPAHLFRPENALRIQTSLFDGTPLPMGTPVGENPPNGAIIDYVLKSESSEPVTLEIYNNANKLVRRYSSANKPPQINAKSLDIPVAWVHPPEVLAASAGMHRFLWDLRWTAPAGTTGRRSFFPAAGPWVLPDQYTVKLTAAGQTYSQPLTVTLDPRVKVSNQELQAQFNAAQQVDDMTTQETQARQQAMHLHQQLQKLHTNSNQAVAGAADNLDKKLLAVLGNERGRNAAAGPGAISEDFTSLDYLSRGLPMLSASINSAPAAPTASDLKAIQNLHKVLESDMAAWNQIKTTDVPQLNTTLRQNNLPAVE
ncbi:MAG TPA: hypothetical protein VFQ00_05815 [Terriglobales bacterium]|nr:hypothetical protein [Terriglobales bacterium]